LENEMDIRNFFSESPLRHALVASLLIGIE